MLIRTKDLIDHTMSDNKLDIVKTLVDVIPELTVGQLHWIHKVVNVFREEHDYSIHQSDIFNDEVLRNFGDAMRVHHSFSNEPFSKDKFEYVFVEILKLSDKKASLAPKGNPGHDITVDEVKISLKTQANKNISENLIWVSKFMELGKGKWKDDPKDLSGLRQQFLDHLKSYDRILSLRCLNKAPHWKYELVEIPKKLLQRAENGLLEMKTSSKQLPKPGYCYVNDENGQKLFDLYFDGGTERKLQIKKLHKNNCAVHAQWEFILPQE